MKVKLYVSTGFAGCEHIDYVDVPDDITEDEKIKNMTIEEMVEFINCEGTCNYCIYADDDNCKGLKCREGVKAWLNQEVTDNDEP